MKKAALFLAPLLFASAALADTITVHVPDMECESCSSAIEARVKREPGIVSVKTDVKERVVTIVTADTTKLTDDKVKELVKDAGFSAEHIDRGEHEGHDEHHGHHHDHH